MPAKKYKMTAEHKKAIIESNKDKNKNKKKINKVLEIEGYSILSDSHNIILKYPSGKQLYFTSIEGIAHHLLCEKVKQNTVNDLRELIYVVKKSKEELSSLCRVSSLVSA